LALYAHLAVAAVPGLATADETLFCNHYVMSLPYKITAPGHYCFARNLSTPASQVAVNNRVIGADTLGFSCGSGPTPLVVLRDNIVLGVATPYGPGCTKIGATNFP
jgi:hypothetical protein